MRDDTSRADLLLELLGVAATGSIGEFSSSTSALCTHTHTPIHTIIVIIIYSRLEQIYLQTK